MVPPTLPKPPLLVTLTAAHDRPRWLYLADGTNHEVWILRTGQRVQKFAIQPSGVK